MTSASESEGEERNPVHYTFYFIMRGGNFVFENRHCFVLSLFDAMPAEYPPHPHGALVSLWASRVDFLLLLNLLVRRRERYYNVW